jgi:diaminohydroxyphosphoribosylaminopyrimidine deaminase/5-amino-6-(5-phosphoribosylamino)uracil reductase
MTLDGRIATASGESRWITGEAARLDAHQLRDRRDVILVGAGTVATDDPLLTVRGIDGGRDPVRVILDGKLSTSPRAKIFSSGSPAPTLIATTREASAKKELALELAGAEVWRLPGLPGKPGKVDLRALLRGLARRGLTSVLVEGGAETHAAFLQANLCDRLLLYVAPKAIGGKRAPAWLGGPELGKLARAHQFRFDVPPRLVGDDLVIEAVRREMV